MKEIIKVTNNSLLSNDKAITQPLPIIVSFAAGVLEKKGV